MVKGRSRPSTRSGKASTKKAPKPIIYVCPQTNQNVYICKATLKDLKSNSTFANTNRKRLWLLTSPQTRQDHLAEAAIAIANVEQSLLPSFGGRSWEVTCRLTEPDYGQVLFRAWKGSMELAVLPHLLEKIPDPPSWPGRRQNPDEYEENEGEDEKGLQQREVSSLSCVAWDIRNKYPVPTVSLKWKSPDHCIFTSRKSAWEHAEEMASREVLINKHLLGVGASGKLLQPFLPSAPVALKVGRLRFERDGLWVIGQEMAWQEDRAEELLEEEERLRELKKSSVPKSGLALFLTSKRDDYRQENPDCVTFKQAELELRKIWKAMSEGERGLWNTNAKNKKAENAENNGEQGEPETEAKKARGKKQSDLKQAAPTKRGISPLSLYIKSRRLEYRKERQLVSPRFTLGAADTELREIWKTLSAEEKQVWLEKAELQNSKEQEAADPVKDSDSTIATKQPPAEPVEASLVSGLCFADGSDVSRELDKDQSPVSSEIVQPGDDKGSNVKQAQSAEGVMETNDAALEEEKKEDDCRGLSTASGQTPDQSELPTVQSNALSSSPTTVISLPETSNMKKRKPLRTWQPPKQAVERWCMSQTQMDLCLSACLDHYNTVMRTVKARDLHRELQDGFDVFRERGRGRFDMELPAFDTETFNFLTDLEKAPWMPVVRAILGDEVVLIHKGCFISMPGSAPQEYHQDGLHLTTQTQRPCHAINVFTPLCDLTAKNGPTEFCLGSHVLDHEDYDKDFLETPKPRAGNPLIFDYRVGHRGLGNSSNAPRPLVYCTYARASDGKAFRDSVNFSRKRYRRIGELTTQPESREERRKKRRRSMESREDEELRKALEVSVKEDKQKATLHETAIAMAIQDNGESSQDMTS